MKIVEVRAIGLHGHPTEGGWDDLVTMAMALRGPSFTDAFRTYQTLVRALPHALLEHLLFAHGNWSTSKSWMTVPIFSEFLSRMTSFAW